MAKDQQEIRRKLRILDHAAASGDVSKTCRYFGIGRASFYRWRHALADHGEAGLANKLARTAWSVLRHGTRFDAPRDMAMETI